MKISAQVQNSSGRHDVLVRTDGVERTLSIPPKPSGAGSGVNGGELLFLALATCYCNDIYREAARRKIAVESVEVTVDGEFGKEGEPGRNIIYQANVSAHASEREIRELIAHTDRVAEIQNTLRGGTSVRLDRAVARSL